MNPPANVKDWGSNTGRTSQQVLLRLAAQWADTSSPYGHRFDLGLRRRADVTLLSVPRRLHEALLLWNQTE
jgi:hypothetical protein